MADTGHKRGRTSRWLRGFRWKPAVRRVLMLSLLWAVLTHQVGVVDGGVLHDPAARVAALVGGNTDFVIVSALVTQMDEPTVQAANDGTAADEQHVSEWRRRVEEVAASIARRWPVDEWFVGETPDNGGRTVWLSAVVTEGIARGAVDGARVGHMRRDMAWRLASALELTPASVSTAVVMVGRAPSSPTELRDVLRRVGARDTATGDAETVDDHGEKATSLTMRGGDIYIQLLPAPYGTNVTVAVGGSRHDLAAAHTFGVKR